LFESFSSSFGTDFFKFILWKPVVLHEVIPVIVIKMHKSDRKANQQEDECSIPIEEAGRRAKGFVVLVLVVSALPYLLIHGFGNFAAVVFKDVVLFALILISGVVVHELIHAIVFGLFAKGGFDSISFGVDRKTYSPYCHCSGEMKVLVYRIGALAPMVIMGLIPMLYSWHDGSLGWFFFGLLYSMAAGGDWVAVSLTNGLHLRDIIRDHPSRLGFFIVKRHNRISG
jgi:hypothetical protein